MADAETLIWHPQVPLKVSIFAWRLLRDRLPTKANLVPLKVSIFAWRLLRDRLPTKANLVVRGVLSTAVDTCVFGCGAAESAHHLFLSCGISGSIWPWISGAPILSATHLAHMRLGCVDGKKLSIIQGLNK
ncbi:hypothetical protein TSUD_287480 [Trifolium subterraneum]|uniref:Reverse transcriptase zinc-binding domain-containing protein n=1 Tax=Trifolium subterraneum TaxID=3900 RepID=A0A2Z6P5U7_TRISU|nr:hypothetical protein TSUD_287480 [Trifolium subterraneum]